MTRRQFYLLLALVCVELILLIDIAIHVAKF
jgi:hypothetical protein